MFPAGGVAVAKGGRPKKERGKASTKHVRINDDLAEMLSWVLQVLGPQTSSARVLDPHIRGPITILYKKHEKEINALKRVQKSARQAQESDSKSEQE